MDQIASKVDEIAESSLLNQAGSNSNSSSTQAAATQPKLPAVLDDRLTYIEKQVGMYREWQKVKQCTVNGQHFMHPCITIKAYLSLEPGYTVVPAF